jgi:uncharacterized protein DUF3616
MLSRSLTINYPLTLAGPVQGLADLSGVVSTDNFLLLGADEGVGQDKNANLIQILQQVTPGHYQCHHRIDLFTGNQKDGLEMDIEGLDMQDGRLYIVGSHTLKRPKVKLDKSYQQNRKVMKGKSITAEKNRDWLFRLQLNEDLTVKSKERVSLRKIINHDPVLKPFSRIPGKENGIDIEGIAVSGDWLYLGLRGPVLRGNYVPVLKLQFDAPKKTYERLYVQLSGRGCRDIKRISDGFLLIAGPVGDGLYPFQLYHWNGLDMLPGRNKSEEECGKMHWLGDLPITSGKPEGLAIQQENEDYYDILVIYDGINETDATIGHCLRIHKSGETG